MAIKKDTKATVQGITNEQGFEGLFVMERFMKEEELTPEQKKVREIKEKFEKKYANTVK